MSVAPAFDPASVSRSALFYRQLGMQAIPALLPNDTQPWKRPAVATWRVHTNNLTDNDTFEKWFSQNTVQNVGIITGVGDYWVLDIDCHKHPKAMQWLQSLLDAHNDGAPLNTATQRTGGAGCKFY